MICNRKSFCVSDIQYNHLILKRQSNELFDSAQRDIRNSARKRGGKVCGGRLSILYELFKFLHFYGTLCKISPRGGGGG